VHAWHTLTPSRAPKRRLAALLRKAAAGAVIRRRGDRQVEKTRRGSLLSYILAVVILPMTKKFNYTRSAPSHARCRCSHIPTCQAVCCQRKPWCTPPCWQRWYSQGPGWRGPAAAINTWGRLPCRGWQHRSQGGPSAASKTIAIVTNLTH
jgi:hypothetical protein